jgi:DNA-directed RNA polymerase subunit E'/Rpb7
MFIRNKQLTIVYNLEPSQMNPETLNQYFIKELEKKVTGQAFQNIGKILKINKILKFEDGKIHHDTGCAKILVTFSCDVFQPSVDEVLVGRISKLDNSGVYVNHQDMIEVFCLNVQSFFNSLDKSDKVNKEPNNTKNKDGKLQYRIGDGVTFKITKINFNEQKLVIIGKLL